VLDFINDRVLREPVDAADAGDLSVVTPFDLIRQNGCGRECTDLFRLYQFPTVCEEVFEERLQGRSCAASLPFKLNVLKFRMACLCEEDSQIAIGRFFQIDVEATFSPHRMRFDFGHRRS